MACRALILGLALVPAACGSSTSRTAHRGKVTVPTAEDEPWVFPDDAIVGLAVREPEPEPESGPGSFDPVFGRSGSGPALAGARDECAITPTWPGPVTGGADVIGFVDRGEVRTVDWVCDLDDRIVAVDADETDEITGTAWSVARGKTRAAHARIDRLSDGCVGTMSCYYRTANRSLASIHASSDGYIMTTGSVGRDRDHDGETCLATPVETRALCATARRTVAIWPSPCQVATGPDEVKLELGIYDAGAAHPFGDDGQVPDRVLYGTLATETGEESSYGFTDATGGTAILIVRAGSEPSAMVNIDGVDEPCIAFAIDAR